MAVAPFEGASSAGSGSVPVEQLTLNAPKNLPDFHDSYQRHLGVLDTLKRSETWCGPVAA
jgi:hypothetical protein